MARRLSGLGFVALAAVASTTTPGAALAAWMPAETVALSATSVETNDVRLITNPAGEAVLAWREGSNVVRTALRPAGGPFASSQTLDGDTSTAGPVPHPGLGADGRAIVVWFSNNGGRKLRFADRGAGAGSFDPAQDLFTPGENIGSLDVVIDTGGGTHVAYNGPGYAQYPRVWTRTRSGSPDAVFGPESSIPPDGNLSPGSPGQIALATAANGHSALTYYSPSADFAPGSQQQHIEGAVRASGDAGWTWPPGGGHDWFCCLSLGPSGTSSLAMDWSGNTYFAVNGVNDFAQTPMPGPNFVLVDANGSVQGRQQLDPTWSNSGLGGTSGGDPQVTVDPAGNAWLAWAKQVDSAMTLFAAFRPAGSATTFGPPQTIASDLDGSFSDTFKLAATPGGAVLVWEAACGASGCELRSMVSGAASGVFSHLETIATGARRGQGLELAGLPVDRALVVYRRTDGDLEARRFVPPPLRGVAAPSRLSIATAIASGIPVTVDAGVNLSLLRLKLIDDTAALGLAEPVAGRRAKRDVRRGRVTVRVRLTAEAAAQIALMSRVRLMLAVTGTPVIGSPETTQRKIILKQP